jgi:deazaflavin-dependent oxidoreductase (nitroreductase family)
MGCMQIPQWVARFNKYVTNPVQRIWAGYAPTFGIHEYVGRKSGKQFKTPFSTDEGVAILLTYGPNRDWLQNITAANGGRMRRYGRTFAVTDPRVTSKAEEAGSVTGPWRPIFARSPFDQAVVLRRS